MWTRWNYFTHCQIIWFEDVLLWWWKSRLFCSFVFLSVESTGNNHQRRCLCQQLTAEGLFCIASIFLRIIYLGCPTFNTSRPQTRTDPFASQTLTEFYFCPDDSDDQREKDRTNAGIRPVSCQVHDALCRSSPDIQWSATSCLKLT